MRAKLLRCVVVAVTVSFAVSIVLGRALHAPFTTVKIARLDAVAPVGSVAGLYFNVIERGVPVNWVPLGPISTPSTSPVVAGKSAAVSLEAVNCAAVIGELVEGTVMTSSPSLDVAVLPETKRGLLIDPEFEEPPPPQPARVNETMKMELSPRIELLRLVFIVIHSLSFVLCAPDL